MPRKGQQATELNRYIGQRVRERRIMIGMTQWQLAEKVGNSYQTMHKREKGKDRIASSSLYKTSEALGVPVGYFYEGYEPGKAVKQLPMQRQLLELARNFAGIRDRKTQESLCELARVMRYD